MKNIIVPVDFSDTSAAAVRFATYLADVMDMNLIILHVFDVMLSGSQTISHRARERERKRLTQEMEVFAHRHGDPVLADFQGRSAIVPAISLRIEEGIAGRQILRMSTEEDTALVVMGGVGAGAGLHPPGLFGGVAKTVALRGVCPVILIPADYGSPQVERLAIAFDDADELTRLGTFAREVVKALRPEVRFVHVRKSDWAAELKNEEDFLELTWGPGFPSYTFKFDALPDGHVVNSLLQYTTREKIDLLVLGGERRNFFERLFQTTHLGALVRKCEVPLLIIPCGLDYVQ